MAKYFGTNGVRGVFEELTPSLAMKLAQAIGMYFNSGKIIVARDGRYTGECLKHSVLSGLQSVGCKTIDLDYAPAPTAEFMIKKLNADGLIIVTASHNPPEWNALKVVDSAGVTVSRERGEIIELLMDKISLRSWDKVRPGSTYDMAITEHCDAIVKLVDSEKIKNKKPKLVLDCGNGMSALIAPKLFKTLDCRLTTLNSHVDGRFPGRPSEPTEKNVSALIKAVKAEQADAGIAWDGDGDRVIFVDEQGKYIIGDKVFALCVNWKLKTENGDIATTVATSKAAQDTAHKTGNRTQYTKIGAPYLSEEIAKGKVIMAGEEVGGVIYPELSLAKDGFITAAKMVEAICDKPLSKWLEEIPEYFNAKTRIEAADEEKQKIVERVKHELLKRKKALQCSMERGAVPSETVNRKLKTIVIDGVRADFEDSWIICRPSGTEEYVRLFAEAKTEKKAHELLEEWKKIALG
jgi:phosphomannomutase/phosphoglucomutase